MTINSSHCKPIIISHKEDVDGIVAAALLFNVLNYEGKAKEQIKIHLVNYFEYPILLKSLKSSFLEHDIYISDLGITSSVMNYFENWENCLNNNNLCYRYYYDHHNIKNSLLKVLESLFNEYCNSTLGEGKDIACASDLIYARFKNVLPAYFGEIAHYAHLMDFKSQADVNDPRFAIASDLNTFITYHQSSMEELIDLIHVMQDLEDWEEFKSGLPQKIEKIHTWEHDQMRVIMNGCLELTKEGYKFIASAAEIRSGWITRFLNEKYENFDVYVGFSYKDLSLNLRSKYLIMDKVAREFGGGGHEDRAGFVLLENYKEFAKKESFPRDLLQEISEVFIRIMNKQK